ncbi:radical SAM protein [Geomonas sp. Red32]|uniref:radical SAM protein n=1 Tax=Geomonas sp. Red32 TaxID=2912856 RepID=UPI00202CB2E0|nr:radical SAM protein [Geomonas sp. Red32]MCM0080886.1 radical SAM protein [Geomonas sp. Red32]
MPLHRLQFHVTHDCPVSCRECETKSGPWNGPFLDAPFMIEVIDEAWVLGCLSTIVFAGGEPLLKRYEIEQVLLHAQKRGLRSRVVTNAYWAASPKGAFHTLLDLQQAGLSEVTLTCDDMHQELIPLDYIKNAFVAARELGIPVLVFMKPALEAVITPGYLGTFLETTLHGCGEVGGDLLKEGEYLAYPDPASWGAPRNGTQILMIVSPTKDARVCQGVKAQPVATLPLGNLGYQSLVDVLGLRQTAH